MTIIDKIKEEAEEFFDSIGCKKTALPNVKYQVEVTEILRKVIEVELPLGSENEAKMKVMQMYKNEEIVLGADDYYDSDFCVLDDETEE